MYESLISLWKINPKQIYWAFYTAHIQMDYYSLKMETARDGYRFLKITFEIFKNYKKWVNYPTVFKQIMFGKLFSLYNGVKFENARCSDIEKITS